jgi:hypothetical protein
MQCAESGDQVIAEQYFHCFIASFIVLLNRQARIGLIVGLNRAGSAVIKHYALRLVLWRKGYTPFRFTKFLALKSEHVRISKGRFALSLSDSSRSQRCRDVENSD